MPCDRLWAPMLNDMCYGCTSSDNVLALSTLGWMCTLWAAHHQQQFTSLLNAVKVVHLWAEHQCYCLDIDSNRVRVHVKRSMRSVPLWLHALANLFADTPKFFSLQKSTNHQQCLPTNTLPSTSPTSLTSLGTTSRLGRTKWLASS